jgi:hypothetical protein
VSIAELLAKALLQAQEHITAITTQTREQLVSRREELRQAEYLPTSAELLEQQARDLAAELEALDNEAEKLEAQSVELKEILQRKLNTAWRHLTDMQKLHESEMRSSRVTKNFQDAIAEYTSELGRTGLNPRNATPAQLRERFPLLRSTAAEIKDTAHARAGFVSQKLAEATQLQQRRLKLEDRKRKFDHELLQILNRLRNHSRHTDQILLVEDILIAEEGVLKRLRQEVLEPLLTDARLELEQGLIGDNPLDQLADIHRKP